MRVTKGTRSQGVTALLFQLPRYYVPENFSDSGRIACSIWSDTMDYRAWWPRPHSVACATPGIRSIAFVRLPQMWHLSKNYDAKSYQGTRFS
jgi:hypothetical protein